MKIKILFIAMLVSAAIGGFSNTQLLEATTGAMPPLPIIYIGDVTVGGEPAPDGSIIVGKVEDYTSNPMEVKNGRVAGLTVGPPNVGYFGKTITFELNGLVQAEETDVFLTYGLPVTKRDFTFTFPNIPTPTPIPTNTPLPTATPIPATATPLATATPISVGPVVFNGVVVTSGGVVQDGALLTARIRDYESNPVPVSGGEFISLIIDIDSPDYTGAEITFYLDGIAARTTAKYDVGETIRSIDLIFMGLPAVASSTPLTQPTVPPAPQIVSVVEAEAVATETPTPEPEPTPVLNTPTPVVLVVTATSAPVSSESLEPEPEASGGCSAVSEVDPLTGSANVLAMVGPILLLIGFRGLRKLK